MDRRTALALMAGTALSALLPGLPAWAQDVGDQISRQLRRMGYSDITLQRTLLGRLRITAIRGNRKREIIVNPVSGEILRDIVTDLRTGRAASGILDEDDNDNNSGQSRNDDDDDDSSGSGSSGGGSSGSNSSGSGSSGSGSSGGGSSGGGSSGGGSSGGGGSDDDDDDDDDDGGGNSGSGGSDDDDDDDDD
jgi:hypothetical protein